MKVLEHIQYVVHGVKYRIPELGIVTSNINNFQGLKDVPGSKMVLWPLHTVNNKLSNKGNHTVLSEIYNLGIEKHKTDIKVIDEVVQRLIYSTKDENKIRTIPQWMFDVLLNNHIDVGFYIDRELAYCSLTNGVDTHLKKVTLVSCVDDVLEVITANALKQYCLSILGFKGEVTLEFIYWHITRKEMKKIRGIGKKGFTQIENVFQSIGMELNENINF